MNNKENRVNHVIMTFKALNGLAPQYIAEMISHYEPSRCLRACLYGSRAGPLSETARLAG